MRGPQGQVRAYAPASIGNFAAGFDLLGAALAPLDWTLLGDIVSLESAPEDAFQVKGPFAASLSGASRRNLVLVACDLYRARLTAMGLACGPFSITLDKRLPVNSGLGSSASSIVAALVGLQALCASPLADSELLDLAAQAEGIYSGAGHFDNVAPSLLGGLQLCVPGPAGRPWVTRLPWPEELLLVVVHPGFDLSTALSRAALPGQWHLETAVEYAGNLAGFVQALHTRDWDLLARCLRDPLAESYRAPLVPGFLQAQAGALAQGALGCSLSGSGPAMFAVAPSREVATAVGQAITGAFTAAGMPSASWICALDFQGARILPWS